MIRDRPAKLLAFASAGQHCAAGAQTWWLTLPKAGSTIDTAAPESNVYRHLRGRSFLLVRLLIAIPVFNERRYVQHVLRKVRAYHDQILLIDDGSTDGTGEYLASRSDIHLIRHTE